MKLTFIYFFTIYAGVTVVKCYFTQILELARDKTLLPISALYIQNNLIRST